MLDEAMLRPGRLEVQIEIGLPDEKGRLQILKIHTSRVSTGRALAARAMSRSSITDQGRMSGGAPQPL